MSAAGLQRSLWCHRRLGLDTSLFIYHLEANPAYLPLTEAVFRHIQSPGVSGVVSTLGMLELLVQPYRRGDAVVAADLFTRLSRHPNIDWIAPTLEIAARAAELRGRTKLHAIDAVHFATAAHANATVFVTNDAAFRSIGEVEILLLDDFR